MGTSPRAIRGVGKSVDHQDEGRGIPFAALDNSDLCITQLSAITATP
jgi:hypothetical protein